MAPELRRADDLRDVLREDDLRDEDLRDEDAALREPADLRLVLDRLRLPFVSPFRARVLLVVAAAIRLAAPALRPCFRADALIFSY